MESISPHDWLSLVHPVLMILFVYPVFGATVRLGILAREKRLDLNPIADTVPIEHAQHAAWAVGGILVAIPIALSVSLLKTTSPFTLVLVAGVVLFSYSKVLKTKLIGQRLAWVPRAPCTPPPKTPCVSIQGGQDTQRPLSIMGPPDTVDLKN